MQKTLGTIGDITLHMQQSPVFIGDITPHMQQRPVPIGFVTLAQLEHPFFAISRASPAQPECEQVEHLEQPSFYILTRAAPARVNR